MLNFLLYAQKKTKIRNLLDFWVCFEHIFMYTPKAGTPVPKAKSPTPQLSAHPNQSACRDNPSVIFHILF